ncbi:hypothetical protein O181_041502 [Austropuccinia psidii MF-1]|uniref:Reverse transcriptase domain-containing protein n=1 Tax=Austropuccinia psidii MF-1 TaxID=1389203 RepID=A0A9Q3DGU1_9BASI|nr:hypothetical protein [Austropuccinia psidii MF-1]
MKNKSAVIIRKCHICQSTTHLANACPKRGKINEIEIEKEPDAEKDDNIIEENSDDNSSIFSESSKDIENINATFDIIIHNRKDRYFTIGDNKNQKFAFLPFKTQITLSKVAPVNLELEIFKYEQLSEAEISPYLTDKQENELSALSYDHKEAFASNKEPLGVIIGYEFDIILNIKRPYTTLLRRPAYPASPKSREALEIHIKELLDLGVIRKVGHNEEVEITTPVIMEWHNGKCRMVGEFRSLNTYTVPDRYPITKLQIALTQISQAVYIATMDLLKGFHQNVVAPGARKYLKIIIHCGVYEYLRIPFGIKHEPSHFQIMINEIFPEELSEGWLII